MYNEFTVRTKRPAGELLAALADDGILGGVALDTWYPDRPNDYIAAVTEMNTVTDMDRYAAAIAKAL